MTKIPENTYPIKDEHEHCFGCSGCYDNFNTGCYCRYGKEPGRCLGPRTGGLGMDNTVRSRFEKKIITEPNTGCWLWTGWSVPSGYGGFTVGNKSNPNRKHWAAHRLSWILNVGAIPGGLCVLHKCDTPACCNPLHLFLGTFSDNTQDCIKKGRLRPGHPSGLNSGRVKLTEAQVFNIKQDARSQRTIAKEYGVSKSQVGRIKRGEEWKCLECEGPKDGN